MLENKTLTRKKKTDLFFVVDSSFGVDNDEFAEQNVFISKIIDLVWSRGINIGLFFSHFFSLFFFFGVSQKWFVSLVFCLRQLRTIR